MKTNICPHCNKRRFDGSGTNRGYQWWWFNNAAYGRKGLCCWKCSEKIFSLKKQIEKLQEKLKNA